MRSAVRSAGFRALTIGAVLALASVGLASLGSTVAGAAKKSPAKHAAKSTSAKHAAKSTSAKHAAKADSSSVPIKIGFVGGSPSSLSSSSAIAVPAYQAWADSVNAHGGINGHRIEVIVKHTTTNPGIAESGVNELVNQDHVVAIAEISNVDSSFATIVEKDHVPVIGTNISSLEMFSNPDFFSEGQTDDSLPVSVALGAKKVGAKKLGLLYCSESSICQELVSPERTIAAKIGVPLALAAGITASSPNFTAPCLAAKQAGVQALYVADAVSVALSVAQSCVSQGYTPAFIADDGAVSIKFTSSPGWKNGMISMQPDIPFFVKTPATDAMVAAFKKYEPAMLKNPNYNEEVVESWVSGLLFEAAAKAGKLGLHGAPTSAELYNGLYSLHGVTLDGMAPPLTYTKGKANPIDCWFWMRTKDGKFTAPYGLKPVCHASGL